MKLNILNEMTSKDSRREACPYRPPTASLEAPARISTEGASRAVRTLSILIAGVLCRLPYIIFTLIEFLVGESSSAILLHIIYIELFWVSAASGILLNVGGLVLGAAIVDFALSAPRGRAAFAYFAAVVVLAFSLITSVLSLHSVFIPFYILTLDIPMRLFEWGIIVMWLPILGVLGWTGANAGGVTKWGLWACWSLVLLGAVSLLGNWSDLSFGATLTLLLFVLWVAIATRHRVRQDIEGAVDRGSTF